MVIDIGYIDSIIPNNPDPGGVVHEMYPLYPDDPVVVGAPGEVGRGVVHHIHCRAGDGGIRGVVHVNPHVIIDREVALGINVECVIDEG